MGTVHYLYSARLLNKLAYTAEHWGGGVIMHHPDAPFPRSRVWPDCVNVRSSYNVAPGAAILVDESVFDTIQTVQPQQELDATVQL